MRERDWANARGGENNQNEGMEILDEGYLQIDREIKLIIDGFDYC